MNTVVLVRVPYGKKGQKTALREYRIDGKGPVGTLSEFKKFLPKDKFSIIDHTKRTVLRKDEAVVRGKIVRKMPIRKNKITINGKVYHYSKNLEQDKGLKAKHPGKRLNPDGKPYWESRPNRADVNRNVRL